jgi:peroxiredoxin
MKRFAIKHTLLAALIVFATAGYAAHDLVGSSAPDFVLKSVTGANLRLSEYRGQVVMVSFWASWCGDCRAQLEGLEDLYSRYSSAGFQLLAISLDTTRRQASDTAESMDVAYPVLHDAGGEVGKLYSVEKTPVAVLIDRDGIVREVFEGYRRGDEEKYLERVRALLRE